jgi:hypothetical protein
MDLIPVENKEGLYRDKNNSAIVNTNQNEYMSYIDSYKKIYSEKIKINNLEKEVNSIKNDLHEIKNLLRNLANGS